jgi:ankyrin repeat protein
MSPLDRFLLPSTTLLLVIGLSLPSQSTFADSPSNNRPGVVGKHLPKADSKDLSNRLVEAVDNYDLEKVKGLLAQGADPNVPNWDGYTAVGKAAEDGTPAMIQLLIQHGGNVNGRDGHHLTPLLMAAQQDKLDIVRTLLSLGADVNARDDGGKTALMAATEQNNLASGDHRSSIMKLLLDHGADINATDNQGEQAISDAIGTGCASCLQLLLQHGARVTGVNKAGATLLGEAQTPEIAKILVAHGARARANETGSLVDPDVTDILLSNGADANWRDLAGNNALHRALSHWSEQMAQVVKVLIAHGVDVNARDDRGDTPLDIALSHDRHTRADVLDALKNAGAKPSPTEPPSEVDPNSDEAAVIRAVAGTSSVAQVDDLCMRETIPGPRLLLHQNPAPVSSVHEVWPGDGPFGMRVAEPGSAPCQCGEIPAGGRELLEKLDASQEPAHLLPAFTDVHGVAFLRRDEIGLERSGWQSVVAREQRVVGITGVSMPVFDASHTHALGYKERLIGGEGGTLYFLSKKAGKWVVDTMLDLWMTDADGQSD